MARKHAANRKEGKRSASSRGGGLPWARRGEKEGGCKHHARWKEEFCKEEVRKDWQREGHPKAGDGNCQETSQDFLDEEGRQEGRESQSQEAFHEEGDAQERPEGGGPTTPPGLERSDPANVSPGFG